MSHRGEIMVDGRYLENLEVALTTLMAVADAPIRADGSSPMLLRRAIDVARYVLTRGYPPQVGSGTQATQAERADATHRSEAKESNDQIAHLASQEAPAAICNEWARTRQNCKEFNAVVRAAAESESKLASQEAEIARLTKDRDLAERNEAEVRRMAEVEIASLKLKVRLKDAALAMKAGELEAAEASLASLSEEYEKLKKELKAFARSDQPQPGSCTADPRVDDRGGSEPADGDSHPASRLVDRGASRVLGRISAAQKALSAAIRRQCDERRPAISMSIPVDKERDTDAVIGGALRDARRLILELTDGNQPSEAVASGDNRGSAAQESSSSNSVIPSSPERSAMREKTDA